MSPMIDPVAAIGKMYAQGGLRVPYPVFMNCMDKLLTGPPTFAPAPPSNALKPYFRALCQAADLGVADSRGTDRIKEFRTKILPVWKAALPAPEFAELQKVLDGSARREMVEEKRAADKRSAEEEEKRFQEELNKSSKEDIHAEFSRLAQKALEEEDAAEAAEEEGAAQAGAGPAEGAAETEESAEGAPARPRAQAQTAPEQGAAPAQPAAPALKSVEVLASVLAEGKLPLRYSSLESKEPFVQYMLGDDRVTVQLVKTPNSFYLVLNSSRGFADRPDAGQIAADLLGQMGYRETQPLTYERGRSEGAFKLKLGRKSTYIACKRKAEFTPEIAAKVVRELHMDLAGLVLKFQGGQGPCQQSPES